MKTDWSGGIYGSPSFMGTRGGGPIAAAWTALNLIGEDGYRRMARETFEETNYIKRKIEEEIPDLRILGTLRPPYSPLHPIRLMCMKWRMN